MACTAKLDTLLRRTGSTCVSTLYRLFSLICKPSPAVWEGEYVLTLLLDETKCIRVVDAQ